MSHITSLGKYHILERLAADRMSEIYKVKTVGIAGFEKVQVLKRILPPYSGDPRFMRAFIEEAKIAFSLNHRNIVQVFEFGKTGEDLFLAMEHIPGMNLQPIMKSCQKQRRIFPVGLTCYLMGEVAAGLEYAHRKTDHFGHDLGIVHCDLGPRHIACSFEGSVKILEFGLSRTAWILSPHAARQQGNPRYMSPEQVRGEAMDARSDLFSFGIILWEMLTGMPLFEGTAREAIFHKILSEPIPSPRSLNPDVPQRLDELTMVCLVREVNNRFDSASDLQVSLHRVQRQLGAVIGSRALSTTLDDLFPDHSENHDVRQEGPGDLLPETETAPSLADLLSDDSLELREPPLFADDSGSLDQIPLSRSISTVTLKLRKSRQGAAEKEPRQEAGPRVVPSFREAETAGVLRTGRHPDDEPSAAPPVPQSSAPGSLPPLSPVPSDEQTLSPDADSVSPPPPLQEQEIAAVEEPSMLDLLDVELEDEQQTGAGTGSSVFLESRTTSERDLRKQPVPVSTGPLPSLSTEARRRPTPVAGPPPVAANPPLQSSWEAPAKGRAGKVQQSPERWREQGPAEQEHPDLTGPREAWPEARPIRRAAARTDELREQLEPRGAPEQQRAEQQRAEQQRAELLPHVDETVRAEAQPPELEPQSLGEKKRFIAVAVFLEGPAEALEEAVSLVEDIAYKLEGTLHEASDRRMLVLFGLPTADEHDIVAAIHFALDAREAMAGLSGSLEANAPDAASRGGKMRIKTGIRAGTARVGALLAREGYQILGNTMREAEAIARHAPQGRIVLSGVASRLAQSYYTLREMKPLLRHGKQMRCHYVFGPRARGVERKSTDKSPLVGREVEIRAIRSTWRQCMIQGGQRCALIIGEAGIGKSRLASHFLQQFPADVRVVAATAAPHRRQTPNAVLVDLLRGLTGLWESKEGLREQLVAALQELMGSAGDEQAIDTLASLVGPPEGAAPAGGGSFSHRRLHRALRLLLNSASSERPLVLVIEDLHWADSSSIERISSLVSQPEEASGVVLFLITTRPEDKLAQHGLIDAEGVDLVLLDELDDDQRIRLIKEELGGRATTELVQEVGRRAGGNPFYIREMTRALVEMKAKGVSEIPPNVVRVIAGRVDRLPPQVKSVLQHAAVIGPSFREGILARVLSRNPARALAALRNKGIIVPGLQMVVPFRTRGGETEQFEREWAFRNVIIQEVVYESLSSVTRRGLHHKVAEIMVHRVSQGSSDPPAEVARHLELGGDRTRAGAFYLQAAKEAAGAFATLEALQLFDRAQQLTADDPQRQWEIHAGREQVCSQLGLHDRQSQDLAALRQLAGDDAGRLAYLYNRVSLRLLRLGEFYRALAAADQAEAAAIQAKEELARGEALRLRGEAYERLNDYGRAMESVNEALGLFEQQGSSPNQIRALISLGRICLAQARFEEALQHWEPALDLIKQTEERWQERVLRNYLAVVHLCRGDFSKALGEALYSLKLCEQFGDRAREGDNGSVVGILYLELGLYEQARQYLNGAVAIHKETGSQWSEADTLVFMGLLECACRRTVDALRYLGHAREIAERLGARSIVMNARNATALTLCERNAGNDAARAVDEATEAAEIARETRLVVGEIPGLSRAARATALLGNLEAAQALSRRAVELLEDQRFIESSEEEIYYTHFRILQEMGDPAALGYLQKAHAGLLTKMERLDTPEWLAAFTTCVKLNAVILRDHARLLQEKEKT